MLAAIGLLARALGWGALGALSVAAWIATRMADRFLGGAERRHEVVVGAHLGRPVPIVRVLDHPDLVVPQLWREQPNKTRGASERRRRDYQREE